jgi:hypothetical protein
MDTNNWVYIVVTMCRETGEPLIMMVTPNEKLAHEYYASIPDEKPMFYIQELVHG